ncbi:hypothetical protein IFM89_006448 [Coptis chinensis]|uniref:Uncharacterized protein n=1 Tax=Coptis chinensis TaxID=261450 RepID=A0A835HS73_9MAGN|nr:hypothetical protein IFM89_006448 [Coptis chinensis]
MVGLWMQRNIQTTGDQNHSTNTITLKGYSESSRIQERQLNMADETKMETMQEEIARDVYHQYMERVEHMRVDQIGLPVGRPQQCLITDL